MKSDQLYRRQMEQKSKQASELLGKIKSRREKDKVQPIVKLGFLPHIPSQKTFLQEWFTNTIHADFISEQEVIPAISKKISQLSTHKLQLTHRIQQMEEQLLEQKKKTKDVELRFNERTRCLNEELQVAHDKCEELRKKNRQLQRQIDNLKSINQENAPSVPESQIDLRRENYELYEKVSSLQNQLKSQRFVQKSIISALDYPNEQDKQKIKQLQLEVENLKKELNGSKFINEMDKSQRGQRQTSMLTELLTKTNSLSDMKFEIAQLKDKIEILQMEKETFWQQRAEFQDFKERLVKQNQRAKQEIDKLTQNINEKKQQKPSPKEISYITSDSSQLRQEINQLKTQLKVRDETLNLNKGTIQRMNAQVEVNKQQIEILLRKKESLLKQLVKKDRVKHQQLEKKQLQIQKIQEKYELLIEEMVHWKAKCRQIEQKEAKYNEMFLFFQSKTSEIDSKHTQIESLEKELGQLRNCLDFHNQNDIIKHETHQTSVQKGQQSKLYGKNSLEDRLKTVIIERDRGQKQLELVERQVQKMIDRVETLQAEINKKDLLIIEHQESVQNLTHQLFQQSTQCAQLYNRLQDMQRNLQPLTEQNAALRKQTSRVEKELELSQRERSSLESIEQSRRTKSEKHLMTIEHLTQELSEAYQKINVLTAQLDQQAINRRQMTFQDQYNSVQTNGSPNKLIRQEPLIQEQKQERKQSKGKSINKLASYFGFSGTS